MLFENNKITLRARGEKGNTTRQPARTPRKLQRTSKSHDFNHQSQISSLYPFTIALTLLNRSTTYQPGPMYFKTPHKCHLFGVVAEGLPMQVNYLADEGVS